MSKLPITKPTEVSASWMPYSNSVACSARRAKGSNSELLSPNATSMGIETRNSDRRMGVSNRVFMPARTLVSTLEVLVASSTGSGLMRIRKMQTADTRKVRASR